MYGPAAAFRDGQWQAVESLVQGKRRLLVVQRTGWGKSLVYFLSAKLLREQKAGPTLLISPLLSLMRNQIEMARRIGINAHTIHSGNRAEWEQAETDLTRDACDVLLISPERLNNEHFLKNILPRIGGRVGLFVIDEAHCISDWGHDFRPDYRRIVRILNMLPQGVPVMATTATANDRVVQDVQAQLGANVLVQRGALTRESLRLQNLVIPDQATRLAWLAENLPKFPGSGVIYCLTVADTERVARWLRTRGLAAQAYNANLADEDRVARERQLLDNQIKALVATVALGMGFDKPDLGFVIHFQSPGSVVAYYQQVGRAGRAVERAYGILLGGSEDAEIQDYFIKSALPPAASMLAILHTLAQSEGMTLNEITARVNISHGLAETAMKILEIEGAVGRDNKKYFRTPRPWQPDIARIDQITAQRRAEQQQMRDYLKHPGCLMEFLARALDDPGAKACGMCANCKGKGLTPAAQPALIAAAQEFLRGEDLILEPRKRWPIDFLPGEKSTILEEHRNAIGRFLSYYGQAGWGIMVKQGKYGTGRFDDQLVAAAAEVIRARWHPEPPPEWVTTIPSLRHTQLVADFGQRLAGLLNLPYVPVLKCTGVRPEQKTMANSHMQAGNARAMLAVAGAVPRGPVLLVDDIVDSGWTMTLAGWLLRTRGSGVVHPFALARSTSRDS
jgi:ATP-dependent DNA helicase RecQ